MPAQSFALPVGRPTQLAGGGESDFTLQNTGTVVAYLDDSSNVTADSQPLNPGASLGWDAGRPCWALAAVAGGKLTRSDNSGAVSDPTAIATALTDSGLATAIATALAGSALAADIAADIEASALAGNTGAAAAAQMLTQGLPAAHATAILSTGVKVLDAPVTYFANRTHNLASPSATASDSILDTSGIQSLIVELDVTGSHGGLSNPAPGIWLRVDVAWANGESAGFSGLRQTVFLHQDDDSTVSAVRVPALGTSATVTFTRAGGANTVQLKATAIGSLRPCDGIAVSQRTGTGAPWLANVGADPASLHLATDPAAPVVLASGTRLAPLPPRAGLLEVTLSPDAPTTATEGRFALLDHNGIRMGAEALMPINTPATKAGAVLTARVGWHPVYVFCDTAPSGPTHAHISATWLD